MNQYFCINVCLFILYLLYVSISWITIRQFSWYSTRYWIVFLIWIHISNYINIVAYRPVAKRWLCKERPLLRNGSINSGRLGNACNIHARNNIRTVFSMWFVPRCLVWSLVRSDEMPNIFMRDKPIFSAERMLHKDYYRRSSTEKKISGRESQGAWRQDELIGGKPPVVK
jgi:hypothetical protein